MSRTKRLVIVQPYVPTYRVAFFEQLIAALAAHGIDCKIAASTPDTAQSQRGDAASPGWVIPISQRRITLFGRSVGIGGARKAWKGADAVIVGLVGSSLDTYRALLEAKALNMKVGVWGHVKPYVNAGNPIDLALERWQLRKADHVFAYTPGGTEYARQTVVDSYKVTTVMNAVDTRSLADAAARVTDTEAKAFAAKHNVDPARTLAFIGGLDSSKRIDFLAEAMDAMWLDDPRVKVLIGGLGNESHILERAAARGQAIMLGYVDASQQALIARNSAALVMPGRIGLVAVDALVLGLPVLTTSWPFHAPEHEYLVEGQTKISSANNVTSFVNTVLGFLADANEKPSQSQPYPTLEKMVANFTAGVLKMLETKDNVSEP